MVIDVEICGQLLIAWRREEHLGNVAACIKVRCRRVIGGIKDLFCAVTDRVIIHGQQASTGALRNAPGGA